MPNTLVFVDFPTPDPEAAQRFYEQVFGWTIEGHPQGDFHRIVPGEGLHLGIYNAATQTPNPSPDPAAQRNGGLGARTYILVENAPDTYLPAVEANGGKVLWREAYWGEFDGWHASFLDPWGNQIIMWWKGRPAPDAQ
jgi:predicted enzyme related to lactoylglutathione lyase